MKIYFKQLPSVGGYELEEATLDDLKAALAEHGMVVVNKQELSIAVADSLIGRGTGLGSLQKRGVGNTAFEKLIRAAEDE